MEEMMNLVNGFGMSAAEVTQSLSAIGNGNMLDGISNIYYNALECGEGIGYRRRQIEEALENSTDNTKQRLLLGGGCLLVGAGLTAGGIWLAKKLRAKKTRLDTQAKGTTMDDIAFDQPEETLAQ